MQVTNRLDKRVSKIEKTVADIKEKAEVDEGQRYQLLQARKSKVISACGGTKSNYYIEKKAKKYFPSLVVISRMNLRFHGTTV